MDKKSVATHLSIVICYFALEGDHHENISFGTYSLIGSHSSDMRR